ncbi:hypothetical protein ACFXGI_37275 [Streptomyces sp. NPDC059355]|uniref:hypothetical protein n=1 Tax=Streptomyces sp. NPDC059355 TaxID=3346811 RepID=UPI00368CE414
MPRTRRVIVTAPLTLSVTGALAACGTRGAELLPDPKVGNASAAAPVAADTATAFPRRSRPA